MVKIIISILVLYAGTCLATPSFVKKVDKKKNSQQLKQESAEELEALLTQTIDMIASLGELQKELIRKIQEIVVSPSESFFGQTKQSGLSEYHAQLLHLKSEVEARFILQNKWINDITNNFQKG